MKGKLRFRKLTHTFSVLAVCLLIASALQSFGGNVGPVSSEAGFVSFSPNGESGGAIIPASCESGWVHMKGMCDGTGFSFIADSYNLPYGGNTVLRWNTTLIEGNNAGRVAYDCRGSNGPSSWTLPNAGYKAVPSGNQNTGALYATTSYWLTCSWIWNGETGETKSETRSVTINVQPQNACYPSANPAGYGSACTSATNACGQTQANGTIQCNGTCSSTPPALPAGYGSACTSAANACGMTNAGTITCGGTCSATTPPNSSCASANLTAGGTIVRPEPFASGATRELAGSVYNTGNSAAANFPNVFQVANSSITATVAMVSAGTVGSLVGGSSVSVYANYTLPAAGTYNVRLCANYNTSWGGSVPESNINDNCGSWTTITVSNPTCGNGATNYPTCTTGPGGTCINGAINPATCNVFAPTASLSANPTAVDQGQSATITWNSSNATSCTGTGFSTGGATSGSVSTGALNSVGTQNYQVVCSNSGGSSSPALAQVRVLAPGASIIGTPARVPAGNSTTLTWSANGVQSCTVTGPSGTLASGAADANFDFTTGSPRAVTITGQSTFTITCATNGSPITESIVVNVQQDFEEF